MPCKVCGAKLVFLGQWPGTPQCPNCDKLRIVTRPLAVEISRKRLGYLDDLLLKYMRQFDKNLLIAHIVWAREKFARSFFKEYRFLEMGKFVSYSLLIRKLMAEKSFSGKLVADQGNTQQLIDTFAHYIDHLVDHIYLRDGFSELFAKAQFDPNSITPQEMLSNFVVVPNESFLPVHRTAANNEIYDEAAGKRKFEEYRRERELLKENPTLIGPVEYSPISLITKHYPFLNTLYSGLLKNEIYAQQTFDFANYEKAHIVPSQVMDIVKDFPVNEDRPTVVDGALLRVQLDKVFDGNLIEIERIFVFTEENQGTFPLFVELDDRVLIPQVTTYLIFLLLHPILHRELFRAETERRSKELESVKVKEAFEKAGFRYYPNLTDKVHASLEIDGIATRKREMYVIEVKGWGINTYFEQKERQAWLIRDIQGIVDGWKFSTIDGIERKVQKVSLLEKIEFAKQNMTRWGLNPNDYDSVTGVIVIKDYPPIGEYKGVKVISVEEIAQL